MTDNALDIYDVFLSYSHQDADWVERLAVRLEDECSFRVWLDRWVLVPGRSWQQAIQKGLDIANSCAVCFNGDTPRGWFQQEIERSLDLQTRRDDFRIIPVLLPETPGDFDLGFLGLRTWADFREDRDQDYAFHVLVKGIKGEPIGRWPPSSSVALIEDEYSVHERLLLQLQRFRTIGIHEEVMIEFEKKILNRWLEEQGD